MEVKIDFNEKSLQEVALRDTILKGAIAHLMSALTPEALQVFVEKVLAQAFDKISNYDMCNALKSYVESYVREYMETPEVQERACRAAREAIDTALGKLPTEIASQLVEMAQSSFREAVKSKLSRY